VEKVLSKKISWIKRRLHRAVSDNVAIENDTKYNIEYEVEEDCDGIKPSLIVKIKNIIKKR
jgi:hypothetical protein